MLDTEVAWRDFHNNVADAGSDKTSNSRYTRINPEIGYDPPRLDDVEQLRKLREDTQKALETDNSKAQIEKVVHTLVASCFYYERSSPVIRERHNSYICQGSHYFGSTTPRIRITDP